MIALLLLSLLGCERTTCVDETGYEDCSGGGVDTQDDVGGVDSPAESAVPGVWYTADGVLGASPTSVAVLAVPGVFPGAASVSLSIDGGDATEAAVADGGFVGDLVAALDDVVLIVPDVGDGFELSLTNDLSRLASPASDAAGGGGPGGRPTVVDGSVAVGDGALPFVVAPYLAWIEGRPLVAQVGRGASASLPASAGDTLCVAALAGDGGVSPRACVAL